MLELIPVVLTIVAAAGYGTALARLHRRGARWPASRTACLLTGSACVCAAVLPPISSHDEYFPVHIGQHLLLGMAGPAFLALAAPVTVMLRALPRRPFRAAMRLLHSRPVRIVSSLPAAIILNLGGLYLLYLTGLYRAAENNDLIHAAVHLHMFLAGCLLSWALIGLDPIRRRPGIKTRLAALIVAGAAHDTLAKLMYAHALPSGGGSVASRLTGAELLYYGGTVIDVALAAIVMAQWYAATGRSLARAARRPALRGLRAFGDGGGRQPRLAGPGMPGAVEPGSAREPPGSPPDSSPVPASSAARTLPDP
jgi:putative membrane protein